MNIGVFVDVSDLYYRIQRRFKGKKLDFEKYMIIIETWGTIFRSYAYGMQKDNEASGFIKCLRLNGFEPRYKRPKVFTIGDREIKQCDWGVGLTIDVIRLIDKLDIIVLGVSNPDYIPLVKWLRDQGKIVRIFASCVPKSLCDAANEVVEIQEHNLQS